MFFPAVHLPQILELHCIDEKMHCAPSSYTSTTESFSMQSGTKVTQLSLSYSRWVQRSCVTPRDVPQSWKHAASFPGFQGRLAAPNILQKKDLEQWKKSLSLHPLLYAMVSPAQQAVYKCSSGPVKSWPRFFKLSQRWVLSKFSLQVIRFTYSSLMTGLLWLMLSLFYSGRMERGKEGDDLLGADSFCDHHSPNPCLPSGLQGCFIFLFPCPALCSCPTTLCLFSPYTQLHPFLIHLSTFFYHTLLSLSAF